MSSPFGEGGGSGGHMSSTPLSPRSSDVQSPATLPLDISAPGRIVQKQVVDVRAHRTGCTAVLYLRLALPASSKTRSFPLFPDEGVKLKSSTIYPVELSKANKLVIPPDASKGLKRASQILALDESHVSKKDRNGTSADESSKTIADGHDARYKQVKPRITSSQFHITIVCPPSRDGSSEASNVKRHFVALIQIEIGLNLSPPLWPYEAQVPLPRCLNNRLRFTTEEIQQEGQEAGLTVEFDPPLVRRPALHVRKSVGGTTADESTIGDEGDQENNEAEDAITGPFPSTGIMTVRWAHPRAGIVDVPSTYPLRMSDRRLVSAKSLACDVQVLNVEHSGVNDPALVHVRIQATLSEANYPGLEHTALLALTLSATKHGVPAPEMHWIPSSLIVQSERSRTLQSWSIDGQETTLMSRSTSANIIPSSSSMLLGDSASTTPLINESADATFEEEGNLIDVQPPKGIVDTSLDASVDLSTGDASIVSHLAPTQTQQKRNSLTSLKSLASEYSQHSAIQEGSLLQLVLRMASLRQAKREGVKDLRFSIEGLIKSTLQNVQDDDGDSVRLSCPALTSPNIPSTIEICSVTDDVCLVNVDTAQEVEMAMSSALQGSSSSDGNSSTFELIKRRNAQPRPAEEGDLGDYSADTSSATLIPRRATLMHQDTEKPLMLHPGRSEASLEILSLPVSGAYPIGNGVEQWSGMIESATMSVWMSNVEGYTGNMQNIRHRKAVHRLEMSWPRSISHGDKEIDAYEAHSTSSLLPFVVFALPTSASGAIDVLHASVHGRPMSVSTRAKDQGQDSDPSSTIVDLRLPNALRNVDDPIILTLIYTVRLAPMGSFCLFPPIASTVAHFQANIYDECIKEKVPIVSYTNGEPISSSMQNDLDAQTARTHACMLPSMTSVLVSYAQRTKPLVPLVPASVNAPVRRQSFTSATLPPADGKPASTANEELTALIQQFSELQKDAQSEVSTWSFSRILVYCIAAFVLVHGLIVAFAVVYYLGALDAAKVADAAKSSRFCSDDSGGGSDASEFTETFLASSLVDEAPKALALLREQSLSLSRNPVGFHAMLLWLLNFVTLPARFFTNLFGR